jgi:hypothetical protein
MCNVPIKGSVVAAGTVMLISRRVTIMLSFRLSVPAGTFELRMA